MYKLFREYSLTGNFTAKSVPEYLRCCFISIFPRIPYPLIPIFCRNVKKTDITRRQHRGRAIGLHPTNARFRTRSWRITPDQESNFTSSSTAPGAIKELKSSTPRLRYTSCATTSTITWALGSISKNFGFTPYSSRGRRDRRPGHAHGHRNNRNLIPAGGLPPGS